MGQRPEWGHLRRLELTFLQVEESVSDAPPCCSPETLLPGGAGVGGRFPRGLSTSLCPAEGTSPFKRPGVACFLGNLGGAPLVLFSPSYLARLSRSSLDFDHYRPPLPNTHGPHQPPQPPTPSQRGFNIKQTQRAPQSCALGRVCAAAALQIVNLNCSPDSLPPLFDFSQP